MERIEGMSIGLNLDTLKLDSGLTDLKSKLSLVNSEMKANLSAFDKGDKSIEKYQATINGLNKKLEVQKAITEKAQKAYQKAVEEFGEGSKEADKAARAFNNQSASLQSLQRSVDRTTKEMNDLQSVQKESLSSWDSFTNKVDKAGQTLSGAGEKLKGVGQTLNMSVTAPLIGLGGLALKSANDFDRSQGKMQASLGLTTKETKRLSDAASDLWKKGFGESIEEVSATMTTVEKNMSALSWATQDELKDIGKSASILFETFDADVNDTTKVANSLMMNFAKTSKEAFDLITWGFQNGLDFSGEFLDTINEYAPQFAALGYEAEEMFAVLEQGAVNGAFNLDKVGDAVKEFNIRIKDGSKTTAESMSQLSKGTQNVWKSFKQGKVTGKEVMDSIIKDLSSMDNQVKANQIAVGLFGTQWEDLEKDAVYALGNVSGELSGVEGATDKAGVALQRNFGERVQTELRELGSSLTPLGDVLMDVIEPAFDSASDKVEKFTGWVKGLSPEGQKTILMVGGLVAAIGPLVTGLGFASMGVSALIGGLGLLTGPVGLTVVAVAGLAAGYVALDKAMDKPIIKSDIFVGEISNATKAAVGSYMKLDTDATAELNSLALSQATISQAMANDMVAKYEQMGDRVLQAMKDNHIKQLEEQQSLFDRSSVLTEQEEAKRIAKLQADQMKEIQAHNETQARIKEIWMTAVEEKRGITTAEAAELAKLQSQMRGKAVQELSASQQEQETILRNLKTNKSIIEAETAANTVKKSTETRDKVVKEAEQLFNQTVSQAEEGRDRLGTVKAHEAAAIIKEAEKSKNESIAKASDMHDEVVRQAKLQAGEHAKEINWETGQVLSGWDSMYNGVISAVNWIRGLFGKSPLTKRGSVKENGRQTLKRQNARLEAYATGTPATGHPGGPAIVGEEGMELAHIPGYGVTLLGTQGPQFINNLPRGSSVLPNKHTENILKSYGFPGYKDGIGDYFDVFLKGAGNVWSLMKDKFKLKDGLIPSWLNNHTGSPLSMIGEMAKSMVKNLWDNWFGNLGSGSNGSVKSWIAKAVALTGVPSSWIGPLSTIAMKESGGNPKAINLWDINAKSGIPSKGLMQTIDPTFNAHKLSGMDDIWNPVHNAVASIRYILSRYGTVFNVPGIKSMISGGAYRGYATGGRVFDGLYRLGEGGWPEWIIPTDPARRTDAMKLLALAGKEISGNKRPHQLPGVNLKTNDTDDLKRLMDMFERFLDKAGNIGGINQSVTINSPAPTSPSENARQLKQTMRQWALEWRR
ncbi:phage tail tape measure protein [Mesobacillus jeotgali]|uniref:phage tail tape measure protein n=1 Tax=Mesobacillus jeotgali TaxID=129985 RepID=UPI001CFE075A|nr:phage tail tape measure protein [Mesobacillus jeotgali]